jgi:hypothetical protein
MDGGGWCGACSCFKERVIDQIITGAHARDSTKTEDAPL